MITLVAGELDHAVEFRQGQELRTLPPPPAVTVDVADKQRELGAKPHKASTRYTWRC
jgi:hypothetical protein